MSTGKVYVVGAGPGGAELLTVRALKILRQADLVFHDDLVSPDVIDCVSPSAHVQNVGKRCGAKHISQNEINELMIQGCHAGYTVVRIKSGDPLIFGRAAEEIRALQEANVLFEIVPGIGIGMRTRTMDWVQVTSSENIPRREGRSVQVGKLTVAIFNVGDRFLAIENRCPHSGGPLCEGILSGTTVVCPLHAWKIDLESGTVLSPKDIQASVQTLPARQQNGIVTLGLEAEQETFTPPAGDISAFQATSPEAAW